MALGKAPQWWRDNVPAEAASPLVRRAGQPILLSLQSRAVKRKLWCGNHTAARISAPNISHRIPPYLGITCEILTNLPNEELYTEPRKHTSSHAPCRAGWHQSFSRWGYVRARGATRERLLQKPVCAMATNHHPSFCRTARAKQTGGVAFKARINTHLSHIALDVSHYNRHGLASHPQPEEPCWAT